MILNLILLVLLGAVAFFQYLQGLFSATISAIIAIIAAVIAISYHEPLAALMIGTMPEFADAISLVVIFAAVYFLLRLAFDAMVPGNVRFPVLMDKVGAAVMGLIVGLVGTGIVAIAAQTLPFSHIIGMYSRFDTLDEETRQYSDPNGRAHDSWVFDALKYEGLDPDKAKERSLWFAQDNLVIGMTNKLSDGGSLAGRQPLAAVHPDFLTELFGQRLGIQVGAKHTLVSTNTQKTLSVTGAFTERVLPAVDGEMSSIRQRSEPLPSELVPGDGQKLLILRTVIQGEDDAGDADKIFRFSPGAVRLMAVADPVALGESRYQDYYPVATLDPRKIAVVHRVDDPMFSALAKPSTIDFVFVVSDDVVNKNKQLNAGTFLEVKRYARVDLSNAKVAGEVPPNPDAGKLNELFHKVFFDFPPAANTTTYQLYYKWQVEQAIENKFGAPPAAPAAPGEAPAATPAPAAPAAPPAPAPPESHRRSRR